MASFTLSEEQRSMPYLIPNNQASAPQVNDTQNHVINRQPQQQSPHLSATTQQNMMPPLIQHTPARPASALQTPSPNPVPASERPEESLLYINAKQFHRILKHCVIRQKLKEALDLAFKEQRPYLHESRHKHAIERSREFGDHFLSAKEVTDMMKKKSEKPSMNDEDKENADTVKHKKQKSMSGKELIAKQRRSTSAEKRMR